tara:strand:+ start:254 stop:448 length:195 start_codon:yes stop_codon:yes gene_type:complete
MNHEQIEESINILEERLGNMEGRLIQCEDESERFMRIKKAMDECENAINEYKSLEQRMNMFDKH